MPEVGFCDLEIKLSAAPQPLYPYHMGFRAVERFGKQQLQTASVAAWRCGGHAEFDVGIVLFKDRIPGRFGGRRFVDRHGKGDRNAVLAGKRGGFYKISGLQPCGLEQQGKENG